MRILRGAYLLMVVAGAVALAPQPAAAQLKVSIGGCIMT